MSCKSAFLKVLLITIFVFQGLSKMKANMESRQPWLSARLFKTSAVGPAEAYQQEQLFNFYFI